MGPINNPFFLAEGVGYPQKQGGEGWNTSCGYLTRTHFFRLVDRD
jgi:hypothetical protein